MKIINNKLYYKNAPCALLMKPHIGNAFFNFVDFNFQMNKRCNETVCNQCVNMHCTLIIEIWNTIF